MISCINSYSVLLNLLSFENRDVGHAGQTPQKVTAHDGKGSRLHCSRPSTWYGGARTVTCLGRSGGGAASAWMHVSACLPAAHRRGR